MNFTKYFTKILKYNYKTLCVATGISLLNQLQFKNALNQSKNLEFTLQHDNSIMLEGNTIDNDSSVFKKQIEDILEKQKQEGRKCAWLKLNVDQLQHLDYLVNEQGFKIHHSTKGYIMLTKWLNSFQAELYMPYATHMAGSGGIVVNQNNEILLVKEKQGFRNKFWAFPGGRVDLGESMHEAALREVREETGLICEPKDLFLYRDLSKGGFEKPDMYFLYLLKPLTNQITICQDEIADYKWVPISELDKFIKEQEFIPPLVQYVYEKLFQLHNEGYNYNDDRRVQEFFTSHNNSNYNIYIPIRGFL